MPRELAPAVSPTRLPADAVNDAFVSAVVPPGLAAAEDARARSDAAAFLAMLLRHLDGDPGALPEIAAAVRAVAGEVVRGGGHPGVPAPMGFCASSEQGAVADIRSAGVPVRQCPVAPRAWEAAVPNLPIPGAALFLPLAAAGRSFGMLYALRDEPVAFSSIAERSGARFVVRVEPALAWAMQLRSLRRWADA